MPNIQMIDRKPLIVLDRGDGRILEWNVNTYEKTRYKNVVDVFSEVNGFWAKLTQEHQERIWRIYEKIYDCLCREFLSPGVLLDRLACLVSDLYDEHSMADIEHWVRVYGDVKLPESLKDRYDADDNSQRNVDQTYLRDDYIGLVVLTIALRPMMPIWGEYLLRIRDDTGNNFKEIEAFRILRSSHILVSGPMERLRTYIKVTLENDPTDNTSAVINGLGTEELPDWLLAIVVVRRIAPGDVDADEGRGNIITNIWAFLKGTLTGLDRKFGGKIRNKFHDGKMEDGDNNSQLEQFKLNQSLSAGDVAVYSIYTESYVTMAQSIDPTISEDSVISCVKETMKLQDIEVTMIHLTLCQWVINKVMPARAIDVLDKPALLRVMGVTQAVLWHWGLRDLAILVSAKPLNADLGSGLMIENRNRIPQELSAKIQSIYLYPDIALKVTKAIQMVSKEIGMKEWRAAAPKALLTECAFVDNSKRMMAQTNVLESLAKLIIKINEDEGLL